MFVSLNYNSKASAVAVKWLSRLFRSVVEKLSKNKQTCWASILRADEVNQQVTQQWQITIYFYSINNTKTPTLAIIYVTNENFFILKPVIGSYLVGNEFSWWLESREKQIYIPSKMWCYFIFIEIFDWICTGLAQAFITFIVDKISKILAKRGRSTFHLNK